MPMQDPCEQQRLKILFERASSRVASVKEQLATASLDINKDRTQYFEKIALGCGATIALVVSFVGAKAGRLQPPELLRSALVALALAMICAMYRNLRYPTYALAARLKQLDKLMLEEAECRRDYFVCSDAISLNTGGPIDAAAEETNFQRASAALSKKIMEFERREARVYREVKWAEKTSLFLAALGFCLLVTLTWLNF